jgi:heavy metal sensor kinase
LKPVVAMSETARRISAQNLDQRLPIANQNDELGQLASTFNQLLARLSAAFLQQRQFMADASHELRTPLYVINTTTQVTLEQPHREESEYRDALMMIDEQSRRLTHIVEDMFTLARADAGRRELQKSSFYLDELTDEAARAARVLATPKGVAVEHSAASESPYYGDEGLLRQMILNLLDNAIKHTPTGGKVSLQLTRESENYLILVADTGSGIPPEAQSHIFERFYRADVARSSQEGSAGLGLAICRWIAEAHGGTLALESAAGETTFTLELPLA